MKIKTKASAFIISFFLLMVCASVPMAFGAGDALDSAIRELSDYLNRRIPKGSKAVFLNVKSDWPGFSEYILDNLQENAVNDGVFAVVDRQQLDAIRSELNFQWSGEVSDKSAQEIGQMLGAQTIVSGVVSTIGSVYRIQARAIAVQTAAVQGQFSQNVDGKGPTIAALTKRVVPAGSSSAAAASTNTQTSAGTQTAQAPAAGPAAAPATPAQPAAPAQSSRTYKVGDTGPAGGLIFYDKGNNNGGWRYLEAAPAEAEFRAVWSEDNIRSVNDDYDKTKSDLGSGKKNTELIVKKFRQATGNWNTAAQKANDLSFNGFEDWFLPSQAELDQIFGNLKRKNLGDFKDGNYWSSAQSGYEWQALSQDFRNGKMESSGKANIFYVRPIRQVAGTDGGSTRTSAAPVPENNEASGTTESSGTSGTTATDIIRGVGRILSIFGK